MRLRARREMQTRKVTAVYTEISGKMNLIQGSLPTLFMSEVSEKKVPITKKKPRFKQRIDDRVTPHTCATLTSLITECRNDDRWQVVEGSDSAEFYFLNKGKVDRYVQLNSNLQPKVVLHDTMVLQEITETINFNLGFAAAAKLIESLRPCPGILDNALQQYADWSGSDHYREVRYLSDSQESTSVVRSTSCDGVANCICKQCTDVKSTLVKRSQMRDHTYV